MPMLRLRRFAPLLGLALLAALPAFAQGDDAARRAALERAADNENTWRKVTERRDNLTSREIFVYALALAEAGRPLDRLETLFEVAAQMQDRDPDSPGYGNFRWSWSHDRVLDYNAVEFSMEAGTLLWMRHRDKLPPNVLDPLATLLDYSVEGVLRHRVPESYTNIAIMNAQNLILLGETLDRPELADEGYQRLARIYLYTWEAGIHEYGSPTYYGVDLGNLAMIERFAGREIGREQARRLLELFWTDIALHFWPPAGKYAGARSRDYDYLRGLGHLDEQLRFAGWVDGPSSNVQAAMGTWQPPERLLPLRAQYPRLVRSSWGLNAPESRTFYALADVALGSAAANYGTMDIPLAVDLPGERESVRGYFIPDGRHDPYGKVRIVEGSGAHSKTLHLTPFFTAAQRNGDALALVAYRDDDLRESEGTLESHFVLPRQLDELWVGSRRVELGDAPVRVEMAPGEALVARRGSAAVGVRVPWARGLDGRPATVAFVDDANQWGAVRVTVEHHGSGAGAAPELEPAALLWVRVDGGLDDAGFAAWRAAFGSAEARVDADGDGVDATVAGADGPVRVAADAPFIAPRELDPAPTRAVLELNGEAIGRPILAGIEPVSSLLAAAEQPPLTLAPAGTTWEAEAGVAVLPMAVGEDADASGGRFVWMPGEPGQRGGSALGRVSWRLAVPQAGNHYLWARVQAATPDDDSFFLRLDADAPEFVGEFVADWHIGTHEAWEWVPFKAGRGDGPSPLALPAGNVMVELRVREDGAKVDRLFVSTDPEARPE